MKINLVGCGGISKCHLNAINVLKDKDIELTAVADIVPERADRAAQDNNCRAYYDYIEMLDNEKPDVVHICTPHYLHVEMAVEALKRNINVVLEKPCGTSADGLKQLIKAEEKSNGKVAVCFQNRYNSSVVFAKELIESKKYGDVKSARAVVTWRRDEDYYNADEWRGTWAQECGGVLINQAIHTHDLMQYLCGKTTDTVEGHISNFHLKETIEVEDTASVYFTYTDGSRAVYFATNAAGSNSDPIVEITCEKAVVRVEGSTVYKIDNGAQVIFSQKSESDFVGKKEWGDSHTHLISDFYDCVRADKPFFINAKEASRAVYELLAVYESSKSGKTIVMKDFVK
ncbi:MAG: Gfo/Idh/MocA family oxidoreductase [Clostridia bacterium]|nr:Gfo/Idh/MocA family oxidoreductase [Clostridia bacterium]